MPARNEITAIRDRLRSFVLSSDEIVADEASDLSASRATAFKACMEVAVNDFDQGLSQLNDALRLLESAALEGADA